MEYWGPISWIYIHSICAQISQNPCKYKILELNKNVNNCLSKLPCKLCCNHVDEYIKTNKLPDIAEELPMYFFKMHNSIINAKKNRKSLNRY